ncbi:glutamate-1-semialdehyde 2,1-aminomutase [Candidatus Bathyarchaeota archaeon]|nr:glutamate-1-semialdehyde 2,1-aminomutase [Candidatus Bathyarchaeota archaeon]
MLEDYVSKTQKSRALYERAKKVLPAGVSYGIRFFEPYPFYTARAKGSKLYDIDGNEYIDYWIGHGAHILGHSPSVVVEAVKRQVENGTHFGTSHELEVLLAEQVVKMVPSAEMVRFTNSGTEANMYAIRLARAYTGKSKIIKFEGGWHGGYDALHIGVKYPFHIPESAGLTVGATQDTVLAVFNNFEDVEAKAQEESVAAIIVEPVLGAGGSIPAEKEFLRGLREICDERGILLIYDEVITGFRLAPGGAQQYFGVLPDITVFGKILGGGFPVGAFSGRREIMERLNPLVYERPNFSFHGGTFCANPITMAAGLAVLKTLEDGGIISRLNKMGEKVRETLREIFEAKGVDVQATGVGSLFNTHFTSKQVRNARDAFEADRKRLAEYHINLIVMGVFFLPTHFGSISAAHTDADIEKLFQATEDYAKIIGKV